MSTITIMHIGAAKHSLTSLEHPDPPRKIGRVW